LFEPPAVCGSRFARLGPATPASLLFEPRQPVSEFGRAGHRRKTSTQRLDRERGLRQPDVRLGERKVDGDHRRIGGCRAAPGDDGLPIVARAAMRPAKKEGGRRFKALLCRIRERRLEGRDRRRVVRSRESIESDLRGGRARRRSALDDHGVLERPRAVDDRTGIERARSGRILARR
jgi:hypothetical protein